MNEEQQQTQDVISVGVEFLGTVRRKSSESVQYKYQPKKPPGKPGIVSSMENVQAPNTGVSFSIEAYS